MSSTKDLNRPVFVIIPGTSQNPSHYATLERILQYEGYPTISALLPPAGSSSKITVEDDMVFIRDKMIMPILDREDRDVILIMHYYSGVPGSAAALGLGKASRAAQGKKGAVIGQIFIASLLVHGGYKRDIFTSLGGQLPPFLDADRAANLIRFCDPVIPFTDLPASLASQFAATALPQSLTTFYSPVPETSWAAKEFEDRVVYIRMSKDNVVPDSIQQQWLRDAANTNWKIESIESDHSLHISEPDKLYRIVLDVAARLEAYKNAESN